MVLIRSIRRPLALQFSNIRLSSCRNILRNTAGSRRVLAQAPPGAFHGIDDPIFAHLQLRPRAQATYTPSLLSSPAMPGLRLAAARAGFRRPSAANKSNMQVYEPTFRLPPPFNEKSCISPKISRRPRSISSELDILKTPGTDEKLSIDPTWPNRDRHLPIEATEPEKAGHQIDAEHRPQHRAGEESASGMRR